MSILEQIRSELSRIHARIGQREFDDKVLPRFRRFLKVNGGKAVARELSEMDQARLLAVLRTEFGSLRKVPKFHGTRTGRFVEDLKFKDIPEPGFTTTFPEHGRDEFGAMTEIDFASVEARVMAYLDDILGEVLKVLIRRLIEDANMQRKVDEQGCGAAMAFLKYGHYGERDTQDVA